ncbi:MAG: hypothetical protein H7210_00760 [Pyrinomonadaceae bacterium]|nr:hypothetical protein [Phycisphaerales bacterium]
MPRFTCCVRLAGGTIIVIFDDQLASQHDTLTSDNAAWIAPQCVLRHELPLVTVGCIA